MHSDDRDPVDVLAEEFADLLRRGEHPSVSAYAAAHPDHAEQLNELLPAVAQMELLKRFRSPATADKSLPDRLGDFRIVRELGRGGMGVVFEAVQESLGRPVALKVLARHAQLDPTQRERFVREAQAAAKLHHTNIVPVFGVGEQDGLPYYVMQLIPGHGLHTLVRQWRKRLGRDPQDRNETQPCTPATKPADTPPPFELPESELAGPDYADWRFVAEIGLQAADALHYSHKQGILHRDVKPANLILDGEIAWVADFGLAKMMNTEGLTATGDILGTLQYLAPECLTGNADPRSDVYGLGATLYELLTLEPPHGADSPAKLIKKLADTDPTAPRALNPNIPRDLETIVLKAMAREPSSRYASARDLARDLEAFLDDRPIEARRTTTLARVWRTCRRNPAVASLAFSTAAALVFAAVTGWVGFAREEDRRKDAEAGRAREEDRRKDAEDAKRAAEVAKADADRATNEARELSNRLEANLKLSLETFEEVFEVAGGSGQPGFGVPTPARPPGSPNPVGTPSGSGTELASDKAAILEAVLAFYDKFAEQNAPNQRLQFEAAKASRRVCEANLWLKRPEQAVAAFNRAVALLGPLVETTPDNNEMRTELVLAYLTAPAEAFPADREFPFRRAAELARGDTWLGGSVQLRLGWLREQAKDRVGAATAYSDAATALASVPAGQRPPHGHLELALVRLRLAWVLYERSDYRTARKTLEKSIEELRPFVKIGDKLPGPPQPARDGQAMIFVALVTVCRAQNDNYGVEQANKGLAQLFPGSGPPSFGGPGGAGGGPGAGFGGPGGGFGGPAGFGPGGRPPFGGFGLGGKKDGGPGGKKDGPGGPKKN